MVGDISFDELRIDRCRRRRKTTAAFRQVEETYRGELNRYRDVCRDFLALLIRAPREVIYAYYITSD